MQPTPNPTPNPTPYPTQPNPTPYPTRQENSQFNITLPPAIDEYYVVKQKSIDDGWEPGQGEPSKEKTETPGRRLGQALMKRAIATIPLIQYMQKEAQGMYRLHQKNMCSLQQWKQFQTAESMVSGELEEVKAEADEVEPGWSQQIWAQAAKYHQLLSERAKATEAQQKQQKASMQTQQMKIELERKQIAEKQAAKSNTIEDEARQEILAEKAAKELTREEENKSAKKSFKPGNGVKKGFLK